MLDFKPASAPGNILVVDDNPVFLGFLADMLTHLGHRVRPVLNGRLALRAAEVEPPDLILLDIGMPDMDGIEVCRQLKQNNNLAGIPIIFISAVADIQERVHAFEVGGVDFVTKPFHLVEVAARVDTQLRLHSYQSLIENLNNQLAIKVRQQATDLRKKKDEFDYLAEKNFWNFNEILSSYSNLIMFHSPEAYAHAINVAEISARVATAMGLTEIKTIQAAGMLHDLGKIWTQPANPLFDLESVSPKLQQKYLHHPIVGQTILNAIEDLRDVGTLIRHHHESMDGSGFPDGLIGTLIPVGARIIGIADALDHWIIGSSQADPINSSLERLKRDIGNKFDPTLYFWFRQPVSDYYDHLEIDASVHLLAKTSPLSKDPKSGNLQK